MSLIKKMEFEENPGGGEGFELNEMRAAIPGRENTFKYRDRKSI